MDALSTNPNRTLTADVRLTSIDLKNDQVWEFSGVGGEPPALALQTSYGLRCRGIKIFPRFTLQGTTLTDPRTFAMSGSIEKRYTNYLLIHCAPFTFIDVELEYWVPTSNSICGKTRIVNNGRSSLTFGCEWAVLLHPHEKGEAMANAEMGVNTVLRGASEDLFPVFFLTGGPQPSAKAYPALNLEMTLAPGAERRVSWSLASLDSYAASFTLARQNTAMQWDADLVKQEMAEKRQTLHFLSDQPEIDDLLHEAQIKAQQNLIQGPPPEKRLTLLNERQPDHPLGDYAYSIRTRMGNLPATTYDLWQASRLFLPSKPEVLKELIQSFIDVQQVDGVVPWMIYANGTASKALAAPLLAGIARDIYTYLPDSTWLAQVYPPLLESFKAWFSSERLANSRQMPVWTHLMQTGLDTAPLYSIWQSEDQGLDLRTIDSPALGAMLYHEGKSLLQIGQFLQKHEAEAWLQTTTEGMKAQVLASWNEPKGTFTYRDIQTGCSPSSMVLFEAKVNGISKLKLDCKEDRRLLVRCLKGDTISGSVEVVLQGKNGQGEVSELFHFSSGQFQEGTGRLTSQKLFGRLDRVEVRGLQKTDQVVIALAGYDDEDISLLLPLWAGIPTAEQAGKMLEQTLLPRYVTRYGLSNLPLDRYSEQVHGVSPLWNELIVEGLLDYGFRKEAASLYQSMLVGIAEQRQASGFLNEVLSANDARGLGKRDTLKSLPGILPLLRVLGIDRYSANEILFSGLNEYLPPFTVQYGRSSVQMNSDGTSISMISGSKIEFHEPGMHKSILP